MTNSVNENTILNVWEIGRVKLCVEEKFKIFDNSSVIAEICELLNDVMSRTEDRDSIKGIKYPKIRLQDPSGKFVTHEIPTNDDDDIYFPISVEFMPIKNKNKPIIIFSFTENDWFKDTETLQYYHYQGIYKKILNYYN